MTQRELDNKMNEYQMFILDKFRDIQAQANTLKSVDRSKNEIAFAKIADFIADVRHAQEKLDELETVIPTPETEEESDVSSGMSFFDRARRMGYK